jgi:MFS family permease
MADSSNPNMNMGSIWVVVGATSFVWLAVSWSWYSYPLLVPTLMKDMRLSYVEASFPMSLLMIGYMLLQIPGGILADRHGARLPITCGTVLCSASSLSCGVAASPIFLLSGRLLLGIGSGLCFIPAISFISTTTPLRIRGRCLGVYGASATIGGIAAFVTTPLIEPVYGWRGALIFPGLVNVAASLLFWISTRRWHFSSVQKQDLQLTKVVLGRQIWMLNYLALTMLGVATVISTWAPTYLIETHALGETRAGILLALFQIGTVAGMVVGGSLSDIIGKRAPLVMGFTAAAMALTAFVFLDTVLEIALCLTLIGFFLQFGFSSQFRIVAETYGPSLAGRLNGIINTFAALGASFLTVLFAQLVAVSATYVSSFITLAGISAIGSIVSLAIRLPER